jgi:molybdopterin molybdotransferase
MAEPIPVVDALHAVLERITGPLPSEQVSLAEAAGRVLASTPEARLDLPPFPSSAMDGFAVRAEDTPGRFPVAGHVAAGRPSQHPLAAGEAMGIATGGVVPEGADAVVQIERVTVDGETVDIPDRLEPGTNIRYAGRDVAKGAPFLGAGRRIGPAQVGALAAAGHAEVECARRPRVALLSTGTELRKPGEELRAGDIYESNGPMLRTLFTAVGAEVALLDSVADDEAAHREAIEQGLDHDVLVTSGGVSVGPHDLVRRIEAELGVEEVFWGVSVRPGKPLAFGVRGRTLVFGLPGNPVSSLVCSILFVLPALRKLQGEEPGPHYEQGALSQPYQPDSRRDELVRARLIGDGLLQPLPAQESHMIVWAASADALVYVPSGPDALPAGTPVRYLHL